jgi:hypothetical protein
MCVPLFGRSKIGNELKIDVSSFCSGDGGEEGLEGIYMDSYFNFFSSVLFAIDSLYQTQVFGK